MENTTVISSKNRDTNKQRRFMEHRFLAKELKSPFRLHHECKTEDILCLLEAPSMSLIDEYSKTCTKAFYKEHAPYLVNSAKELAKLAPFHCKEDKELINERAKPLKELIRLVEEYQEPIVCIDQGTASLITMLVYGRVNVSLLKKHWKDLPEGELKLMKANEFLEELASGLKIPRRTSVIIKRKNQTSEE
ncbi:MAG TPA: hypothetical protein VGB43_08755 [Flavobacterium sp.]|jgi:hypothetical protein